MSHKTQGIDMEDTSSMNVSNIASSIVCVEDGKSKEQPEIPRPSRLRHIFMDTWIPEVLALASSIACLFAIVAVMLVYRDNTIPNLPYGITLNAVISVLGTTARSMILYVVGSSIGQLKWVWYHQGNRSTQHMQDFDDASRGPLGSISFLFSPKARSWTTLGAIITVLALAFDPFIQQILTYHSRSVLSETELSSAKRARVFSSDTGSPEWINALNAGIFAAPAAIFERQPICTSGNCTWPPFVSVEWCSKCGDAGPYANVTNCDLSSLPRWTGWSPGNCTVDFGHGSTVPLLHFKDLSENETNSLLDRVDGALWLMKIPEQVDDTIWLLDGVSLYSQSENNRSYMGVINPVAVFGRVVARPKRSFVEAGRNIFSGGWWALPSHTGPTIGDVGKDPFEIIKAEECVLSLCERTIELSVVSGVINTLVKTENFGKLETLYNCYGHPTWLNCWQPHGPNETTDPSLFQTNDQCYRQRPNEPFFRHPNCDETPANSSFFCPARLTPACLDTSFTTSLNNTLSAANRQRFEPVKPIASRPARQYNSPVASKLASHNGNLSILIEGIAAALTQLSLAANTTEDIYGTVFVNETFVATAWNWLILPVALSLGSAVLLSSTAMLTRRHQVNLWKSSVLPLLYRGPECEQKESNATTTSSMTKLAQLEVMSLKNSQFHRSIQAAQ